MTSENTLKALSTSTNDLIVGNYMVLFGGRDLSGEFFTKSTKFESNFTNVGMLYVDFEHGLDPDDVGMDGSEVLGVVDWKSAKVDEKGIFVERVLNRRASYMDILGEMIKAGVIGTSSQCAPGKSLKKPNGEITEWPLMRDSLTVTPMEPRMVTENLLAAAKSLAGIFPHNKSLADMAGVPVVEPDDGLKAIETIKSLRDAERFLRDSGISRTEAVAFMSRVKSLGQSDSEGGEMLQIAEWLRKSHTHLPV
jgi:hypothetical protein